MISLNYSFVQQIFMQSFSPFGKYVVWTNPRTKETSSQQQVNDDDCGCADD